MDRSPSQYRYAERAMYTNGQRTFNVRVVSDCYVRFHMLYDSVDRITITSIKDNYYNIPEAAILDVDEIRLTQTWGPYIGDSEYSVPYRSILRWDAYDWDFSVLGQKVSNLTIYDLSGNGLDGRATVSNITRDGMYFNGQTDYIEIPYYYGSESWTIIANYKRMGSKEGVIFHYGDYTYGYGMWTSLTKSLIRINGNYWALNTVQPTNEQNTFAITYDRNTKHTTSYKNGEFVYQGTNTNIPVSSGYSSAYIGKTSTNNRYFEGVISSIMVFDRELTAEEISNIYNSSGTPVTNGLMLYYDLTTYSQSAPTGGYYPIHRQIPHVPPLIELPLLSSGQGLSHRNLQMLGSGNTKTFGIDMKGKYHIYKSGLDVINIEFDTLPYDLQFSYKVGDKESNVVNVDRRVYSIKYNFSDNIEFTIRSGSNVIKETLTPKDLSNTISVYNNNYYYIGNNKLYKNDELLVENALNIHNNLVLLKDNKVFDLKEEKVNNYISSGEILADAIPLYSYKNDDEMIYVYHEFTLVSGEDDETVQDVQIIKNNDNTYIFDIDYKNNYQMFNTYNTKEYQVILNKNNKLVSLKNDLNMGGLFINEDIESIAFDQSSNSPVMMVRYSDGDIIAVNYNTGETLFEANSGNTGLLSYVSKRMFSSSSPIDLKDRTYGNSVKLIETLNEVKDDVIKEKLNINVNSSKNYSDKDRYKTYYNSSKGQYEVIDTYTSLKTDSKETKKVSTTEKIESDSILYEYFYGASNKNGVKNSKNYLYMIIIAFVIINLVIFVRKGYIKYGKERKA